VSVLAGAATAASELVAVVLLVRRPQ
jgi:hypothetical protein